MFLTIYGVEKSQCDRSTGSQMFKLPASIFKLFVKENKTRVDKNSSKRIRELTGSRISRFQLCMVNLLTVCLSVDNHMIRVIVVLQSAEKIHG